MKKTYSNPNMQVVTLKTQKVLMMSTLGTTSAKSGNLGRDFDMDDDFEE